MNAPGPRRHPMVEAASRFADEELFPAALETDAAGTAPVALLDQARELGLYGIFSPESVGGSALDLPSRHLVQESMAGGCLTTAFVWQQHAGVAGAAARTEGPVQSMAAPLAAGDLRGGVAFAHLLRPGVPVMQAEPDGAGWRFTGRAPWVTGWGHIDLVLTAARHGGDIIWAMLDARDADTLTSERLSLAAVDATDTCELTFAGHRVPADRVTSVDNFEQWLAVYRTGLRSNGSLALGITSRVLRLLGPSAFDDELRLARRRLDTVANDSMPEARGEMGALCVRAAAALVAHVGGSGMTLDHHAQRLAREALFLLVQGQTPEIKQVHISRLGA